jgi:hypothetical protein
MGGGEASDGHGGERHGHDPRRDEERELVAAHEGAVGVRGDDTSGWRRWHPGRIGR